MSDVDVRLAAALGADAPPARDALFRLNVLARLERSRFQRRMARTVVIALVAAVLLAVNAAAIDAWMNTDARHGWFAGAAALAVTLACARPRIAVTPGAFRATARLFGNWFGS